MTAQRQTKNTISIDQDNNAEINLAFILFAKKTSLRDKFETHFGVKFDRDFHGRGEEISFSCAPDREAHVREGYARLVERMANKQEITKATIEQVYAEVVPAELQAQNDNKRGSFNQRAAAQHPRAGYTFTPRTEKQANLADMIVKNDYTFALGPAGTGKTHVAVAKAVEALKNGDIEKILLARPAKSADEELGHLPGDANEKLGPYMQPLYDELAKTLGRQETQKMMEKGIIEIVPVGFMRGRTFENAFVVLDEAQNCNKEQVKMALTRLGPGSRMVLCGDPNQVDLEPKDKSGLAWAFNLLQGSDGVGAQTFDRKDIVRHPRLQAILDKLEGDETPVATANQKKTATPAP